MASSPCRRYDAKAMIDEVAALESALRDKMQQKGAGAPADGPLAVPQFDTAVAAYGRQLRAWVDLQVDERLSQVLPTVLEGELSSSRKHRAAASEASKRTEGELRAMMDAQAKLVIVVETMSEEMAGMNATLAAHTAREAKPAEPQDALFAELQKQQDAALATHAERIREELRGLELELAARHADLAAEVRHAAESSVDAQKLEGRLDRELASLAAVQVDLEARLEASLEARLEARLEAADAGVAAATSARASLESRFDSLQGDMESALDQYGNRLCHKLDDRIESRLKGHLEAYRLENCLDVREHVDASQTQLRGDLVALQERLVKELRVEIVAALSRESAAIMALDEQLWITDQRLGQRIDELAHMQLRMRIAMAEHEGSRNIARSFLAALPEDDPDGDGQRSTARSGGARADAGSPPPSAGAGRMEAQDGPDGGEQGGAASRADGARFDLGRPSPSFGAGNKAFQRSRSAPLGPATHTASFDSTDLSANAVEAC